MSTSPTRILLVSESSEDAALADRAPIDLCEETGSELHVAHSWHSVSSAHLEAFLRAQFEQEAREVLDDQVEWIEGAGGTVVGAQLRGGAPVDEILDLAEELEAGLVVMGRRRRGSVLVYPCSRGRGHRMAGPKGKLAARGGP